MRALLSLLLAVIFPTALRAESLIATNPGTFLDITFPDAVMRTFSGTNPDQLVVAPSGAIGSSVTSGTLQPGSVIQVDFDTPVRQVVVVFEPTITSSVACEVEGIEENGNLVNFGSFSAFSPSSFQLSATFQGRSVRTLRIRPNNGVMRLLRIDFVSLRLRPGQTIEMSGLQPGQFKDVFLPGCEGRSLELTPLSFDSGAELRISVQPVGDPLGEDLKAFEAKPGKSKTFKVERPENYRIRIQNLGFSAVSQIEIATTETFGPEYDKAKFVVDPISNLSSADASFGALPDTEIDFLVKPVGEFTSQIDFALLESPAPTTEADLSPPVATGADKVEIADVAVRKGGLLRLRCSNLGSPGNQLRITLKRSRPLPGVGILQL